MNQMKTFIFYQRSLIMISMVCLLISVSCGRKAEITGISILPSFPGAEGYGAYSKGGRGGDVYIVTNLKDTGPGSLRYGIESAEGPRTIVFDTAGTIELKSRLTIRKPYITIAGQTAPGDGIALKDWTFEIMKTHDIIVRYIRIRLGDKNKGDVAGPDAIQTNDVSNIIFDHISASWGIDGTHDLRGEKFTLQWSIYGECLNRSLHEKGEHAMLASYRDLTDNISLHHNLMHSSRDRHPSLGGGSRSDSATIVDFRNNVVFNWRGPTNFGPCQMNIINNFYKPGLSTDLNRFPLAVKSEVAPKVPQGWVSGNYFPWNKTWTEDNFSAIEYTGWNNYKNSSRKEFELFAELVTDHFKPQTQTPQEAYELVLQYAGASKSRDAVDERIIRGVIDGTNRLIDTQDDVGGWPALECGIPPSDTDKDGMPDYWEIKKGLDPENPEDRNLDFNGDGYTNLEKYLHELTTPTKNVFRPRNIAASVTEDKTVVLSWNAGSGNETEYVIERDDETGFRIIARIDGGIKTFNDKMVSTGNHTYRIMAVNDDDVSYYSEEIKVGI